MSRASLSNFQLLQKQLLRIRRIEEAIAHRYSQQKMRCPVHLSIGQEAIAVGVCAHLEPSDYVISTHRAHAHYLAKGGDLKRMIAEIYGKETGCSKGRGGSMHLVDLSVGFLGSTPIVGGSIPVGVGCAFASKLKEEERVTVIFFGEGTTEEGVFAESLNFAALHALPVLFICENNLYSVYSPLSVRQSAARSRVLMAQSQGMFAWEGDGNDLESVLKLTAACMQKIIEGKGPCFLELSTYRFREHCGPFIDPYQPKEEVLEWAQKDPIQKLPSDLLSEWNRAIDLEIEEAFAFAESSPFPAFSPNEEDPYV